MSTTGEYYHLIFPQKLSSGVYLFLYADDENNVVGLIQTTTESVDTQEDGIPYEYVVDTMGYDILDVMECENGQICDDYDSSYGEKN